MFITEAKQFIGWLNQPAPAIVSFKKRLTVVLYFCLTTIFFFYIYQPFGLSNLQENNFLHIVGLAGSGTLGLAFRFLLLPALFPNWFVKEKWTVKRQLLFALVSFAASGTTSYLYLQLFSFEFFIKYNLLECILFSFSLGIIPLLILLAFVYVKKTKQAISTSIPKTIHDTPVSTLQEEDKVIHITPTSLKEKPLKLCHEEFILAKSDNNYITIYYYQEHKVSNILFRLSMKNLEEQLVSAKHIIRCHRSYMINQNHIEHVNGNSRALQIELKDVDQLIPVSRSFTKENLIGA